MKKNLLFLCLLLSLIQTAPAHSQTLMEISDEKINELETLHTKAENCIVQNDFRGAIRLYEDILLIEPDDEVAYTNLGRIYMIQGENQKARESFRNALTINPENETALLGIEKINDPDKGFLIDEETMRSIEDETTASEGPFIFAATPILEAAVEIESEPTLPSRNIQRFNVPQLSFEKQIQTALRNAGLYAGEIDGKIGPASQKAIIQFQKFHGLKTDGQVGPKTWAVLKPYLKHE